MLSGAPIERDLEPLARAVKTFWVTFPEFGVRRMHMLLRRHRLACTRKEVRSVYERYGALRKVPARRVRTTDSRHAHPVYPNLTLGLSIERPNQVWAADTTHLRIQGRDAYLALVEDLFTRRVMGWSLSFANNSLLTLAALDKALLQGTPEIHHSDQGNTYASGAYTRELLGRGVRISMTRTGCPQENGHCERLNRTFKEEEILRNEYTSLAHARKCLDSYVKLYNERRIHMSLDYRTPREVFEAYGTDQTPGSNPP